MKKTLLLLLPLLAVACSGGPSIQWQRIPMDGHRIGAVSVTAENMATALGHFEDETYVAPSGVRYGPDDAVTRAAAVLLEVQPKMAALKQVVGHSARVMMDDRDNPDLPLGNLVVDALRAKASAYFSVPMDFAGRVEISAS